ncbi:MAG: hypothetical protein V5A72_03360, partial [Candidatus Nanohaloarchaea archaeon]
SKPVMFYGEYYSQPWKELETETEVVSEGSKYDNNRKLMDSFSKEDSESIMIAGDSYVEKGFMKKGSPILIGRNVDEAANLIQEKNSSVVEIVGAENVNFGNRIKDRLGEQVSVIAKFGRKFTGVEGLKGTYPIKKLSVKSIERNVNLESVEIDTNSNISDRIKLVFSNKGNIVTDTGFSAIELSADDQIKLVSDSANLKIRPGENVTLDIETNISFEPSQAEVSFDYPGKTGLETQEYDVKLTEFEDKYDLDVRDVYYSKRSDSIVLKVQNNQEEPLWVGGQLDEINILNRTETVKSEDKTRIKHGDISEIEFGTKLDQEQIESNRKVNFTLLAGSDKDFSEQNIRFDSRNLEVRENLITSSFIRNPVTIAVVITLLLAVSGFLLMRTNPLTDTS